jgi:hypothetical protein
VTPDEMRDAIEAVYCQVITREGGRYQVALPEGITPLSWYELLDVNAEDLPTHLANKAEGLAMAGLYYGCDTYGQIRVQDRPAAQVKSAGGAVMRRPRAFIVHALGWRSN